MWRQSPAPSPEVPCTAQGMSPWQFDWCGVTMYNWSYNIQKGIVGDDAVVACDLLSYLDSWYFVIDWQQHLWEHSYSNTCPYMSLRLRPEIASWVSVDTTAARFSKPRSPLHLAGPLEKLSKERRFNMQKMLGASKPLKLKMQIQKFVHLKRTYCKSTWCLVSI